HIHRLGYFEGVLSNDFPMLDFNEQTGKLSVRQIIDIPHVSQYGTNTVISSNSGRLLEQPDGVMKNFGPQVKLWHDTLLAHEPILIGPCCWVCPWTKVIGESAQIYNHPEEMFTEILFTYLMPFSVSGYMGDSIRGQVPPGERADDFSHKKRSGAWIFTHCPHAVVQMVERLFAALNEDEKDKADIVAEASLNNALCLVKHRAHHLNLDLRKPRDRQRGTQAKWLWDYVSLLRAHIDADIWKFKEGTIVGGKPDGTKWTHEKIHEIRESDSATEDQIEITEDDLTAQAKTNDIRLENALDPDDLKEIATGQGSIHPDAKIHSAAAVDRSAQIGAGVRIDRWAHIGPGTVLEGNTIVNQNARLFRTILHNTTVGEDTALYRCRITGSQEHNCKIGNNIELIGCNIVDSVIGDQTTGVDAKITNSCLAPNTTLTMFAALDCVITTKPTIIGNRMSHCQIDTALMSMHAASKVEGLLAKPARLDIDGQIVEIPAVPMLGGGCQIRGQSTEKDAVIMEAAFIGSNTIIEAGTFVGFGSFVLGQLGPNQGLLPFTVSNRPEPQTDDIGGVLIRFPNMVITHFIGWTYQALPAERAAYVVYLIRHQIERGIKTIQTELSRRKEGLSWHEKQPYTQFKSLPLYNQQQLIKGLQNYQDSLKDRRWDLDYDGTNLSFSNREGHWAVKDGRARWQKKACPANR
ncbi:MAG: hypothetical protein ACYTBZ_08160, partial [Planctomycetota bacterium]